MRDTYGRVIGKLDGYWFHNEDESYRDHKVDNVRFPEHNDNQSSPVTTWNLNDK